MPLGPLGPLLRVVPLLRPTAAGLVLAGGPVIGALIGRTANRRERGTRLALTALQGYGYATIIGLFVVAARRTTTRMGTLTSMPSPRRQSAHATASDADRRV